MLIYIITADAYRNDRPDLLITRLGLISGRQREVSGPYAGRQVIP